MRARSVLVVRKQENHAVDSGPERVMKSNNRRHQRQNQQCTTRRTSEIGLLSRRRRRARAALRRYGRANFLLTFYGSIPRYSYVTRLLDRAVSRSLTAFVTDSNKTQKKLMKPRHLISHLHTCVARRAVASLREAAPSSRLLRACFHR